MQNIMMKHQSPAALLKCGSNAEAFSENAKTRGQLCGCHTQLPASLFASKALRLNSPNAV